MKKLSLLLLITLLPFACKTKTLTGPQTLEFKEFTMRVPEGWQKETRQGYDSYVGAIRTKDGQEIEFDYGWYSNKLNVDPKTHVIGSSMIDGKQAKIVYPKKAGSGTTGVYFGKLEATGTIKFQISGIDLNTDNQRQFLTALETLKFKL